MKRIISALLCFVILIFSVSCAEKDRAYDENEVSDAAKKLLLESEILNDVFWGSGIAYVEDDNYKNGQYYPADQHALSKLGIDDLDSLTAWMSEVYSLDYCESIYSSVFSSKVGENGMVGYTRYYQETDKIMVYSKYKPLITDELEYIYTSVTPLYSHGKYVTVRVSVNVTRGEDTETHDIEFDIVEESGEWRIHTPTYTTYREPKN